MFGGALAPPASENVRRKKPSRRSEGRKNGKKADKTHRKKRSLATPESEAGFRDPLTPVEGAPLNHVKSHKEETDSALPHSGLSHTRVISLGLRTPSHDLGRECLERLPDRAQLDQTNGHAESDIKMKPAGPSPTECELSSEDPLPVMDPGAARLADSEEVSSRLRATPPPPIKTPLHPRPPPLPPRSRPTTSWSSPSPVKGATFKFSLDLSGLGRGLTAGLAALWGPQQDLDDGHIQHVLLPRREVNEGAWAEELMRFADARDRLRSGHNDEFIRQLGLQIESAWREKLSEEHGLRADVRETQNVLEDMEDENEQLRNQVSLLSEQIVGLEEHTQAFQRLAVAEHARERAAHTDRIREIQATDLLEVTEVQTQLHEQQSLSAQLQLVIHAVKEGQTQVLDKVDSAFEPDVEQPCGHETTQPGETEREEDEGDVGDDPLYGLRHHANHAAHVSGEKRSNSMPLETMRQAGLVQGNAFLSAGECDADGDDTAAATAVRVLLDRAAADASLTAALRDENAALRDDQATKSKRYREMQEEVAALRAQFALASVAVDHELDG